MSIATSGKEAVNPICRFRLIHEPFECFLVDFTEVVHVFVEFGDAFACCGFPKKDRQFWVLEGIFEVPFEVFETISMRCKREILANCLDESFLTI